MASCSRAKDGRRTYFKGETRSPIFRDLRSLFEKTWGTDSHSYHGSSTFENKIVCAFLYSSKARREERATSDVDLMIIGKVL